MSALRDLAAAATPPWHVVESERKEPRVALVVTDEDDAVAEAFESDARLIALAPDLAVLADDLADALEGHDCAEHVYTSGEGTSFCTWCALVSRRDTLAARAKGEA